MSENSRKLEWPPRENWLSSEPGNYRGAPEKVDPDDTQYLRADTCTSNEELEKALTEIDRFANLDDTGIITSGHVISIIRQAMKTSKEE